VGGLGDNAHRSNACGLGRGNLERNHAADRDNRYNDAGGRDDNAAGYSSDNVAWSGTSASSRDV
jgi:hypothetical protein